MSKYTRLATTITASYVRQEGAVDGFYLDGRISNPKKYKDKDITLDRADEGFYLAVFAAADMTYDTDRSFQQKKRGLDRICELIKDESRGNIDAAINDMAENALHVAGRPRLGDDEQRLPYYAGILVRDSEMAAVTMGEGLAYLYRDDTIYPLTQDDFKLEAVDAAGRPVDNFDIFGAGKAGTIRYSNISQLQIDDCVILCTREVMEVIGQKGMLELLDKAYDQQEAAELVAEMMDGARPGKPYQFMMSFVEDIFTLSRRGRDRRDTAVHKAVNTAISETAMTDETTRFDPKQMVSPYSAAAAGLVPTPEEKAAAEAAKAEEVPAQQPAAPAEQPKPSQASAFSRPAPGQEAAPAAEQKAAAFAPAPLAAAAEEQPEEEKETEAKEPAAVPVAAAAASRRHYDEEEEEEAFIAEKPKRRGGRVLFTILILILLSLAFIAVWYMLKQKGINPFGAGETTPAIVETGLPTEQSSAPAEQSALPTTQVSIGTTTVSPSESSTAAATGSEAEETTAETTAAESSAAETTETELTFEGNFPETYHVVTGDTMIGIINKVYQKYDLSGLSMATVNELIERFLEINPDTMSGTVEEDNVVIYADTTLKVPDPEGILKLAE